MTCVYALKPLYKENKYTDENQHFSFESKSARSTSNRNGIFKIITCIC